jgi:hypothetical protein
MLRQKDEAFQAVKFPLIATLSASSGTILGDHNVVALEISQAGFGLGGKDKLFFVALPESMYET